MKIKNLNKWIKKWICGFNKGAYLMNVRQNILRWIEALRDENGYCCLGVALCVLGGVWYGGRHSSQMNNFSYLNEPNREKFGLTYNEEGILMQMNDNGRSFLEIANYIENNILTKYPE